MPSALVTGITGQDGGYLAELLVGRGWAVHGATRRGEQPPEHLLALGDAVVLHETDLLDADGISRTVAAAAPDTVFNLAGVSSVARSWDEPALTAEVNGVAVARLLEAVRQQRPQARLVQASSAEIFAGSGVSPQDESTPVVPTSPYGAAKAFAHQLVQVYRRRGVHASNVILYNHESPRRPTDFVTRKITQTVARISRGEVSQLVLGSLDARRDWGWAPEYVEAMTRVAACDTPDDFVIATGQAHSVEEFVAAAFARVGIDDWLSYVRSDPAFVRPTDAAELVGDPSKARDVLGWASSVPFEEVVGRMVDADLAPTVSATPGP